MRPVVDIIADVISAMKPTIAAGGAAISGGGATVTVGNLEKTVTSKLFVGQRIKLTFSGVVDYGDIASITDDEIIITLDNHRAVPPTAIEVVLNYHHGHLLEIKNYFRAATQKSTLKKELFPAIVLVQDIQETIKDQEREAVLRIIILTDSKQQYTAAERYTYTFEPILYPLEELFFTEMGKRNDVSEFDLDYTRYDRLFWGRTGSEENTATNIFNDFIDAVEITDLKIKIIETCNT